MYKYIGDSILNASFTVLVPKPLDNRSVVNNIQELYSIPATYAYLGMTVANIDNGNIYMLVDKSKINQKAGWKASYESIQIITCSYQEYKEWELNTNLLFQPIDDSKEYLHQDTYYYIYEESLPNEDISQEYVKRSDWQELLNQVAGKASNNAVISINQTLANIVNDYATKQFVIDSYAPLSMFDLNNSESFIKTNFFTKDEALGKFVKFSDLAGGEELDENDYIFVTASRYDLDQAALQQYKSDIAEELTHFLRVGADGELGNVIISQIKSPVVDDEQLVVDVTPEGFKVGDDKFAMLSDIPPHVTLTKAEYDTLVENGEVDEDTYYHIVGDDDTYVLLSDLESNYYTKTGVESYIAGRTYSKQEVDDIISELSFYTLDLIDNIYVTKTSLATTLENYVTVAMLGGEDIEGQFIFVKATDYQNDLQALATLREQDLQQIENDYVKKNSDAVLNSVETNTIKNGQNVLSLSDVFKLNDKKLALDEDVPVIRVVTAEEYEELTKDPDVYYFVYNTNENLAFVTAEELNNYYTKSQVDTKFIGLDKYSDFALSSLFTLLLIKFVVEKFLSSKFLDNEYCKARIYGNNIDITGFAPDELVSETIGPNLIPFFRYVITNDTELGNDVNQITLEYDESKVVLTESGSLDDVIPRATVQFFGFLQIIKQKPATTIKQSDIFGMNIKMRVSLGDVYVDYIIAIDNFEYITEEDIQAIFDSLNI